MKQSVILSILLLLFQQLFSQTDTITPDRKDWIEDLLENIESEEIDLNDELSEYTTNEEMRFNINNLSPDIAYKILKMSDYQYYQLLLYIEKYGELVTLHELKSIDGFSAEYIHLISSYLYVESVRSKRRGFFKSFKYGKGEVLLRYGTLLETPAGYETSRPNHYLGSKAKVSFKVKYTNNEHFSMAFAGEKDPGEGWFSKNYPAGFDHYSGHFRIRNIGILKSFVIGDFRINWGQGVISGSGLMSGKGSGVSQIRRLPNDIQAVTSMNEGDYFTGVASSLGNHRWQTSLFYGIQHYDAAIQTEISEEDILYDGTLANNGYHRTEKELAKKRKIKNHVTGLEFRYSWRLLRIGIRSVSNFLNVQLSPPDALYRMYDLNDKTLFNNSIDYHYIIGKFILFGEFASSDLSGFGILQGIIFSPDPRLKSGIIFRKYSKQFRTITGNAFGSNSRNQNETGIYFSNEIILGRKTEALISIDIYQIHWLRYRIDKPEYGEDFTARLNHQISRNALFSFAYLYRTTLRNFNIETLYNEVRKIGKHQFKSGLSYKAI